MDVRVFGSWTCAPKCLFFQDFEGLTEVFALDVRQDIRVDVRKISGPKTYSLGCFFIPDTFYWFPQPGGFREPALFFSEAPAEASLKPDMHAREKLAESKPRRQAEGSTSKRRLRTPDSLEGWEDDLNQKFNNRTVPSGGFLRNLEKAVAVSGVFAGVVEESSGKIPGKLLEKFSRIAKCYKF